MVTVQIVWYHRDVINFYGVVPLLGHWKVLKIILLYLSFLIKLVE
jgi:hypothetical protein